MRDYKYAPILPSVTLAPNRVVDCSVWQAFSAVSWGKALRVKYVLFPSHPQDDLAASVPGLKSFVGLSDLV